MNKGIIAGDLEEKWKNHGRQESFDVTVYLSGKLGQVPSEKPIEIEYVLYVCSEGTGKKKLRKLVGGGCSTRGQK